MLRISKRPECPKWKAYTIRIAAVLLALLTASLFLSLAGYNPLEIYGAMFKGAFGTEHRFKETIIKTIPLVLTSVGITLAFKMKFWNIGGEGQILMGGFAASFFALRFPTLPKTILLPLMMVAALIGGGLWALIPAYFKAKYRTNETIFTLMMNYIAIGWITYLQYGPWKDPSALGFPKIPNFTEGAILPKLFGVHIGWVIALIFVMGMYFFMNYTKKGYEISVIGESENTARYAGISVEKVLMGTLFFSGGICGLVGMIQASAVSGTLSVELTGGVGFTAIITTWLAGLKAPMMVIVSFLFAGMVEGGNYIQTAYQIPQAAADILQGMILFFVLGSEFFIQYKLVPIIQLFAQKQEVAR